MGFHIKSEKLNSFFMLPSEIADKHLKLAGALQLRVLILCFRNTAGEISTESIAKKLNVSEDEVNDALLFWCELGILESDVKGKDLQPTVQERMLNTSVPKVAKPDRSEVARRGLECPEIAFLLGEAQKKFGRMLKQSEASVLVWIFDDLGMDAALILMVIEYAKQAGRCNIGYIERVAKDWTENGIETISAAETRIVELNNSRSAWNIMRSAFGLEQRAPSDAESKLACKCVLEWQMQKDILKQAYDICIDSIGRYKASYIKTILTSWHKKNIKTLEDLEKCETKEPLKQDKKQKQGYAAYDVSLIDKMINGE